MTGEDVVPDLPVPNPARMYDYYLGGKDHFLPDREAAERVIAAYPETRALARSNRRFLTRAVWYLAEHGISQYIDLGAGLPTSPNVHEIARQARPGARVVYVDNDPMVSLHGRVLFRDDDGVTVVDGDIREPRSILASPELTAVIDFAHPVAILCVAVLHFIREEEKPREIVAALRWQLAPGSYLVISHAATDGADQQVLAEIGDAYAEATAPAVPRTEAQIRELFTGLELVHPGLVDVSQWRPHVRSKPTKLRIMAGVGRKPVEKAASDDPSS
jgi:O-methyltransferase involved in polyketide biosynthesis